MTYPTMAEVEGASLRRLVGWARYLPSPTTEAETAVLNRILERRSALREADPADYVAASKAVGW